MPQGNDGLNTSKKKRVPFAVKILAWGYYLLTLAWGLPV